MPDYGELYYELFNKLNFYICDMQAVQEETARKLIECPPEDKSRTCKNCKYFYMHYTRLGYRFIATTAGHCAQNPRLKKRQYDAPACDHFVSRI